MSPRTTLTPFQHDIVRDLIEDTLAGAVTHMERMLKIRINADHIDYGMGFLERIPELDMLGRFKAHVVKVGLIGELKGAFYFIVNGHEVELINRVCLPQEINPESRAETKMMQHGFMSEIENVIASQSAQKISEYLGVEILGGVPEVEIMAGNEINTYLREENEALDTSFYVKSVLAGVVVNVSPLFIWMLDQSFIDILKLNS